MAKVIVPSVNETAFTCPHCYALASQAWFTLRAQTVDGSLTLHTSDIANTIRNDSDMDASIKKDLVEWFEAAAAGRIFVDKKNSEVVTLTVTNVNLSQCFNCAMVAVWVHDRLIYPKTKIEVFPNPDLPADIAKDFEEAREIVDSSPRGAAALLRLCVQKLCRHLGQPGKNIDDDIAALVRAGLSPLIQKSLDIVRVIGNESVHPGTINLNDDRSTALRLFEIVNAIADALITHPKSVEVIYQRLPEAKRRAIERRDQPDKKPS